jgi:hypothetical protein
MKKTKWQESPLHTNSRGNTPKGNNNYQAICTQCQCTQFHQTCSKGLKSTESNTVVVGDFNTPLLPIDRSSKQKFNKKIVQINCTIDQVDLADV